MGHIYVIAGPSGVGKTTFLREIKKHLSLEILPRVTTRTRRDSEKLDSAQPLEDYEFYSEEDFFHGLAIKNGLIPYYENYDGAFYGIKKETIEKALKNNNDSVITSGIRAAMYIKKEYSNITIIFMYTGDYESIVKEDLKLFKGDKKAIINSTNSTINSAFSNDTTLDIIKLIERLIEKYKAGEFKNINYRDLQECIEKRMRYNYGELACVIGILNETGKNKHYINILMNNKINNAIEQFKNIVKNRSEIDDCTTADNLRNSDPCNLHKNDVFRISFLNINKKKIKMAISKIQEEEEYKNNKQIRNNIRNIGIFLSCFCKDKNKEYFSFGDISREFVLSDTTVKKKYVEIYKLAKENDKELLDNIEAIKRYF